VVEREQSEPAAQAAGLTARVERYDLEVIFDGHNDVVVAGDIHGRDVMERGIATVPFSGPGRRLG